MEREKSHVDRIRMVFLWNKELLFIACWQVLRMMFRVAVNRNNRKRRKI